MHSIQNTSAMLMRVAVKSDDADTHSLDALNSIKNMIPSTSVTIVPSRLNPWLVVSFFIVEYDYLCIVRSLDPRLVPR
jgi:hypothetical protein